MSKTKSQLETELRNLKAQLPASPNDVAEQLEELKTWRKLGNEYLDNVDTSDLCSRGGTN